MKNIFMYTPTLSLMQAMDWDVCCMFMNQQMVNKNINTWANLQANNNHRKANKKRENKGRDLENMTDEPRSITTFVQYVQQFHEQKLIFFKACNTHWLIWSTFRILFNFSWWLLSTYSVTYLPKEAGEFSQNKTHVAKLAVVWNEYQNQWFCLSVFKPMILIYNHSASRDIIQVILI